MKTIGPKGWKLRAFATGGGIYVAGAGLITLLGWILNRPRLTDWINSGISAFPNAAICAVLSGIALWAVGRQDEPGCSNIARVLAALVTTIGTFTLSQHIFGVNLGIDTLLFNRPWGQLASAAPMRMGPPASTSFAALGIALFLATCGPRKRRVASAIAVFTMALSSMSLVGYWFGADQLFGIARFTGIALQTTTILAALSIGLILSIPEFGVVAMMERQDAGGYLVRRLILPIIALPLILGWLRVLGQERGLFDTAFGTSLLVLTMIGLLLVLLSRTAAGISRQSEITAKAEHSVREQAKLLEAINDGIYEVDREFRITNWHESAERMFGYNAAEVLGKKSFEVLKSRGAPEERADYLERVGRGEVVRIEAELRRKDGSLMWTDVSGIAKRNGSSIVAGFISVNRDITERKLAEERFRLAVEAAPAAMLMVGPSGTVILANASAKKLLGYDRNEIIGMSVERLVPGRFRNDHADYRANYVKAATQRPMGVSRDLYAVRKDGIEVPVEIGLSPIHTPEGIFVISAITDITERKRAAESEHQARHAAEEANRTKDEFLALLSHELRNPLSAILGWAAVLRSGQMPLENASRALEVIERNARLEAQLVDSLLELSRIASGKFSLDVQTLDLSFLVQGVMDSCRPAADDKDLSVDLEGPAGPVMLVGDPGRLQQIFSNLLTNAVKFTPRGGQVRVRLTLDGSQAQIQVIDNGDGISAEFLPHVFDRFRQAEIGKARAHGGLGLGLAISQELVHAHGGSIAAESAGQGKGATFTVTLPIPAVIPSNVEPANLQPDPEEETWISGLHVLVVDDDADARGLIAMTLQSRGAVTRVASSAVDALEQVKREQPDLIIADIGMPQEDGYELIRKLRALEHENFHKRISAIALTAYASAADRDQALAAGYDIHLTKPVVLSDLIQAVAKLRRARQQQV